MFIVVSLNDDKFSVSSLSQREEVIKQIKEVDKGEYWRCNFMDISSEFNVYTEEEVLELDEEAYFKFVEMFEIPGKIEIKDVKINL